MFFGFHFRTNRPNNIIRIMFTFRYNVVLGLVGYPSYTMQLTHNQVLNIHIIRIDK